MGTRRMIGQLGEREEIDEVYLVGDKQLRPNRTGNLYLQMQLSDRTGSVNAMMWNANDRIYQSFNNGEYVRVRGNSQFYNGRMQIIVTDIETVEPGKIDESDFVRLSRSALDALTGRMAEMLRGMKNEHLRNLAECFLLDEEFMARFIAAPAGVKNHHAYHGGLLEHVVSLMELVAVVSPRYEEVDDDLILMGAFLHDMGKTAELTYEPDLGYSDEGQLIGHVVIAVSMLEEKIREAEKLAGEPLPVELVLRLKHMIVSHHGQYEYGSPKLPMTPEAMALHLLDNLDAKIHSFAQIMQDDVNLDSPWTCFQPSLSRKLYKGSV